MTSVRLRAGLFLMVPMMSIALGVSSCSDDDNPATPGDTTAPGATVSLATGNITASSVQLTWTASGDDGATGTAGRYDIRYSTAAITAGNFSSATAATGVPTPTAAGTTQAVTVSGLTPNTMYHFAMKTADEVPNTSTISNLPSASTLAAGDIIAPSAVGNLSTDAVTQTSVELTWMAPGNDGSTGIGERYDVRYSPTAITAANFGSATEVTGVPTPTSAGTTQNVTVHGLNANTMYHFAMKTADEVPNWSTLSNVPSVSTLPVADVTAPDAVGNLSTDAVTQTSVQLTWMAPGNDGQTGIGERYDIRYSPTAITAGNFSSATEVTGVPSPTAAGTTQSVTVHGLTSNTMYHFAMKTADEVPNWSTLSNLPSVSTLSFIDVTAPDAVGNLSTHAVTQTSVELTWMAPGNNGSTGTAAQYDVRYSPTPITAWNFPSATAVTGVPIPTAAGTTQAVTVNGLMANSMYYFAIKTADEVPNWSTVSNVATAQTP